MEIAYHDPPGVPDITNGQIVRRSNRRMNTDEIRESAWNDPSVPDAPKQAH